jgi:hypothetical protein
MLVGVGGSGKQSLARLAAHISGYDVFQIAVSSIYGVADFKEALLSLYTKVSRPRLIRVSYDIIPQLLVHVVLGLERQQAAEPHVPA